MDHVHLNKISLKGHPTVNESWVQDIIAKDPGILGLGDLRLLDKERVQPRAGRLDLLLQDSDPDSPTRYEVEIQLGKTDESHIIRSIEYWDIERKRYPQYDHVAVLIAEDVSSRFLNVVSLFNAAIPLMALRMTAVEVDGGLALLFTKVLDLVPLGLEEPGDEPADQANRKYWEDRSSPEIVSIADELRGLLEPHDTEYQLNYTKVHIGLAKGAASNNFLLFRPQKKVLRFLPKAAESEELIDELESSTLDFVGYRPKRGRYVLRLLPGDVQDNRPVLEKLVLAAYEEQR